jgi:hypothetical protein
MRPAVDNGGRPDRRRRRTARQAFELRTIDEGACHGASDMTALRSTTPRQSPETARSQISTALTVT